MPAAQHINRLRVDLQLSSLLAIYYQQHEAGEWGDRPSPTARSPTSKSSRLSRWDSAPPLLAEWSAQLGASLGTIKDKGGTLARSLMSGATLSTEPPGVYARLDDADGQEQRDAARPRSIPKLEKVLSRLGYERAARGSKAGDLTKVAIDLTNYEHKELVSEALSLLVQRFESQRDVHEALQRTQLLVKPSMISLFGAMDDLLRQLSDLARRTGGAGRSADDKFETCSILSQLTQCCTEEADGDAAMSAAPSSYSRMRRRGPASSSTSGHAAGVYLLLIGRATASAGSEVVAFTQLAAGVERLPRPGEKLWLAGSIYVVKRVDADAKKARARRLAARRSRPCSLSGVQLAA